MAELDRLEDIEDRMDEVKDKNKRLENQIQCYSNENRKLIDDNVKILRVLNKRGKIKKLNYVYFDNISAMDKAMKMESDNNE